MSLEKLWKEAKHVLAFVLAIALFFNGWANYDFSVFAEGEQLTVELSESEAVYTGDAISLPSGEAVTVKDGETNVTSYTSVWTDSKDNVVSGSVIDVGVYKLTVKETVTEEITDPDTGNKTEETKETGRDGTATFEVKELNLDDCEVSVTENYTYNGSEIMPTKDQITVTLNGEGVKPDLYTVKEYSNNINAGTNTANVVVKAVDGNRNVTGEKTGKFSIATKELAENDVTISPEKGTANATKYEPIVTVTVNGKTLTENVDYTVTINNEILLGGKTYDIVVYGTGNYGGVVTKGFALDYAEDTDATVTVSGNTFDNNVYTGSVTVKPENEKYELSEAETGNYAESIQYTVDSEKPEKLYLRLKNEKNASISQVNFPSFKFDEVAPDLTVTEPADTWTNRKEIVCSADGTGSTAHLYYTESEDAVTLTSPINESTDISALKSLSSGKLTFEENVHSERKFYFYAIDDAGNVAISDPVIINQVDVDAPTITVDQDRTIDSIVDGVYWKNENNLTIPAKVKDVKPGIKQIDVNGLDTNPFIFEKGATEVSADLVITEAGEYTISATDAAANTTPTASITVKQDSKAPEVSLQEPTGTNKYHNDAANVYWFREKNVEVPYTVTDELGTGESETSPYTVLYSTDPDFKDPNNVVSLDSAQDKATIELEASGVVTVYYFKAVDIAGNEGEIQSVQLAYDDSPVKITAANLTQLNGDEWINAKEFEDASGKVAFSVTVEKTNTGIQKIEYSAYGDDENNYQTAVYSEKDGIYTFVTKEEYADGVDYHWFVRVTNNVQTSAKTEIAGGKIDRTAPSTKAYIKFLSDTEGANNTNLGTVEDGKWTSNIYEIVSNTWNKIWGKEKITYEVYVQDVTSGVGDIKMSYNDTPVADLTLVEGLKAFEPGKAEVKNADSNAVGYTVFTGTITTNEKILNVKNFQINSITDVAGNTANEPIVLDSALNTDMIYLDAVSPTLDITIDDKQVATEEKYYYTENQKVVLIIDERFFAQEDTPVMPEVKVSKRVVGTEAFVVDDTLTTSDWKNTSDTLWQVELPLAEADVEMEYQIIVEKYQDPSGNILIGAEGVEGVADGSFTSKIFSIDSVPPKLVSYSITGETKCAVDNIPVYKNITGADDVTVSFTIDENAAYYEADNLSVNVYKVGQEEAVLTMNGASFTGSNFKVDERNHVFTFGFDGDDSADEYYVTISYKDIAGNDMTSGDSTNVADGLYESDKFIIDHVAPVFNVEYSDAVNVVKDGEDNGKQPLSGCTAYYNGNIDVTLTFDEKYVNILSDKSLEHFDIVLEKDGAVIADPEITWPENKNKLEVKFTIKKEDDHSADGNYQFVVKYRDCAFNPMSGDDANTDLCNLMSTETVDEVIVGVYTSPILVLDTTAPVVTTKYMNGETEVQPKQTAYGRDYFNDVNTAFQITVEDRNIRYKELKNVLKGMDAYNIDKISISKTYLKEAIDDITDTGVMYANGKENAKIWTLNLPLTTEANYDIPVNFTDLAGNAAVVNGSVGTFTEQVTTDSTIPGLDLSYSIEDPANYWEWGYLFAKKKMTVTVTATDEIAGVQTIKFTIVDENGKETVKPETFKPVGKSTYSVDIPLETEDFKGSIFAEVFDYSTNTNSQKRGHIVESTSKHSATGTAKITTITNPSRTVDGVDFYNTDVKFQLLLEDTYSGLGSWEYTGGETLKDIATYKADAGTDLTKDPSIKIVSKLDRTLTLDAQKNNKNDVLVKASFVDNVGHELSIEQKYNIDVTKPTITVEYDLNEPANEKYYKETRTATVRITERNFDPSDVEFIITSTDGPKPEISGWSKSGTGDDTVHTCTVTFAQDSDYTFTLKFQDMAGNVADYDRVDEFTIDKTIPVATVTYDNNSFLNEYYYDAARTATIDILEHNFDPSAMEIMVTADGSTAGVPHISAWSSNGDHNIATITFSTDAEYTFDFAGMDLALNELEDYTPDHFVVDQTAPELEIFDIEHMSANNGVVRPGIRYHDTNYDQNGTVILMTGYHNGVVEMTGDRKLEANGLELKLDDFAYVQEMDDIYTMEAAVYDLAGNSSEAMVMFSVNRFGSVYTFDEATDALIGDNGKYYTNKEQQLVITETNVDTLEFKEITLNLNGKLTTLKEGEDYTVALDGNDATWKQYTYTLKADNFVEEGTYILTIYSEDRATNTSDNNTKGKKIEFVVDKTNPSALISGVENGGQYRMHSKEVTIDIEDNVRLSSVTVTIDGVETVYDAAQIHEMDGKLVLNIGSANHWQDVVVEVTDAAGNTEISEEMRVLVTANIFVQFFMNKPVFYGTLGGTALLAALLWWFLVGKKKKEQEEAK